MISRGGMCGCVLAPAGHIVATPLPGSHRYGGSVAILLGRWSRCCWRVAVIG
jgi:hypothetical protein